MTHAQEGLSTPPWVPILISPPKDTPGNHDARTTGHSRPKWTRRLNTAPTHPIPANHPPSLGPHNSYARRL